jgi:hypothetical protein
MPVSQRKFTASDLVPAKTYRVIAGFKDYDGIVHSPGETWKFLEKNFLPYEDGLSLFVERDGRRVQIRLQWREESQGRIIDDFSAFVEEI